MFRKNSHFKQDDEWDARLDAIRQSSLNNSDTERTHLPKEKLQFTAARDLLVAAELLLEIDDKNGAL